MPQEHTLTPYEQRMARLEDKIDSSHEKLNEKMDAIVDTISTFARVEERQLAASVRLDKLEVKVDENDKTLDIVRLQQITSTQSVKTGERIAWAFMTAIVTGIGIWVVELLKV